VRDAPDVVQIAHGSYIAQAAPGGHATVVHYEFAPAAPVDPERLRGAAELLAGLPTDDVPSVASLPSGSHMPLGPNPLFTGRTRELREVASALKSAQPCPACAALTGIGGTGKTQTASEFVHRYGQFFDGGVFWLPFADPSAIPAEVAACGGPGGMELRPDFDALSVADRIRLVMSAWQSELPRLLVFDNCEDETLVAQWRPPTGECRVLMTSRRQDWDPTLAVTGVPLDTLDRSDSVRLLQRYRTDLSADVPSVEAIADELGDLPLALHLAGSYLWRYRDDIAAADYVVQLRDAGALLAHRSLTAGGLSPTGHEQHVARSFAISYDRLDPGVEVDAIAATVLARAAHLAAGEVMPRELLIGSPSTGAGGDAAAQADRLVLADALRRLIDLGLLLAGPGGSARLHRLVAAFVRTTADVPGARETVSEQVLLTFAELHEAGRLVFATELEPHLRALTDEALDHEPDELARELCNMLGSHIRERGDPVAAVPYLEAALRCAIALWGTRDPRLARDLNDLGFTHLVAGDHEDARTCLEAALPLWRLMADEANYAATLDNLGQLAEKTEDLTTAEHLFEEALEIRWEVFGELHERTAVTLTNLGRIRQNRGDIAGALTFYERSLAARSSTLGDLHPATGVSLINLGEARREAGDVAAARTLFEKAITAYETSLGQDHARTLSALGRLLSVVDDRANPDTLEELLAKVEAARARIGASPTPADVAMLNNAGMAFWAGGQFARACEWYLDALRLGERAEGRDHPDLVTVLNNLGMVWEWLDAFDEAAGAYERAQDIFTDSSRVPAALCARVANNFGVLLTRVGDLGAARANLDTACESRRQLLGPHHPDTAVSLANLGVLVTAEGDPERGGEVCRQAIASARGPSRDDRALARCVHQYGVVLLRACAPDEARAALSEAAELRQRSLPERHPDLAATLAELATALEEVGEVDEAREHLREALAICEARLSTAEHGRAIVHSLTSRLRHALARLDPTGQRPDTSSPAPGDHAGRG
jgi:tetratricopeptide (TPR) repeat protein